VSEACDGDAFAALFFFVVVVVADVSETEMQYPRSSS
jgi:hypothetical protein